MDMMSRKHHELVGRLDNMLSRIARETDEIKDLEQQLTDNQILANKGLQKDLEGIIARLKKYLRGVRDQAHKAQEDCQKLQKENEALQRQLEYCQDHCNQLEKTAKATQTCQKEQLIQMGELDALLKDNAALRESQRKICAYEAELEGQQLEHHIQTGQLKKELDRLHRLSLVKHTALQLKLKNEQQTRQDTLAQVQLATEREQKAGDLQKQLTSLQKERAYLQEHIQSLQGLLEEARTSLIAPQNITARLEELIASVSSEQPRFRIWGVGDMLGCSLQALQQEALQLVFLLTDKQQSKSKMLKEQEQASLSRKVHRETELQGLREKLGWLERELEKTNQLQMEVSLKLEQSQEERDCLLTMLEGHCSQARMAEHASQQHMRSLNRLLRKIQMDMSSADKITAQQLTAATDQLSSLHSTVNSIDTKTQGVKSPRRFLIVNSLPNRHAATSTTSGLVHTKYFIFCKTLM